MVPGHGWQRTERCVRKGRLLPPTPAFIPKGSMPLNPLCKTIPAPNTRSRRILPHLDWGVFLVSSVLP